jgi:hypothetical protein
MIDGQCASTQEPIEEQLVCEQVGATGPDTLALLQFPSTASSGRKLISVIAGA